MILISSTSLHSCLKLALSFSIVDSDASITQEICAYFSWTRADLETACRQLGFQGGAWWGWVDRQPGFKPRLLFEEPNCRGTETSLFECNWSSRQLGAGVCGKYHHRELSV